ncbi:hypothetical protein SARC_10329 [Sphaeroforma arctica JP610]|uniref:Uncharacterized protein n=1 Tax=Sphaeroforma arctica JP610 TaxID=667725 RepID=A0A0L0FL64_9EUKA|nr:hypothetical protein, variant [Sphaeroforma arctica JP610]XP_014151113.1 hypothetical protein SARC_10329 [Sphaeroforma arctica JP610]KNC77210.1 hypothetical protein, variant [Sphaeroforma arctica JP610]KNC77211.1 hypothetical protein SARC_10329 [Sphaeroforma arctica JP610]|eukprot:XP_014151112.1 hypothetical protein, variant [Sphaeroforma arctica JP610]
MEKMQSRKQVSKQGLMASGADLETSKVDKDIGLVESKMAAAYQELNVTQSLVDKISEAYWGEIMSFDYLKDQDLRSIHVSRIHAWAETYDGTLGALTTAMKTLQTPVSREHRSIQ